MNTETKEEKSKIEEKEAESGILVCKGALCLCDKGSAPALLKITSHQKYYINDSSGSDKLIATDKDKTFEDPKFGICSILSARNNSPTPCSPKFPGNWQQVYKNIEVGGNHPLLDKSAIQCQEGGRVNIQFHGQMQALGAANVRNMNAAAAPLVNFLVEEEILEELAKEPPLKPVAVKSIAEGPEAEKRTGENPVKITVRLNSTYVFKVTEYYALEGYTTTPTANEKKQIGWAICKGYGFDIVPYKFRYHGDRLETTFDETGEYRIVAFGKEVNDKGEISWQDRKASVDVEVIRNRLDKISGPAQERINMPHTFTAGYLLTPLPEDYASLKWVVYDEAKAMVGEIETGNVTLVRTFENPGTYTLKAWIEGDEDHAQTHTVTIKKNTANILKASATKVRVNEAITLKAMFRFNNPTASDLIPFKWGIRHNGTIEELKDANGELLKATVLEKSFPALGDYTIEVTTAEAFDFKGRDTKTIKVIENEVKDIRVVKKAKLGGEGVFRAGEFEMHPTSAELNNITWELYKGTGKIAGGKGQEFRHRFTTTDKYVLKAWLSNASKAVSKDIEVQACELKSGQWTDADGNTLTYPVGFHQEAWIYLEYTGLEGEPLTLSIYDDDLGSDTLVKKMDVTVPEDQARFKTALDKEIKDKIEEKGWGSYGLLYFKVFPKNGLEVKNTGDTFSFPGKRMLRVIQEKKIIKAYFGDDNDNRKWQKADYKTPVSLHIRTANMGGEELEITVMERMEISRWYSLAYPPLLFDKKMRDALKKDKKLEGPLKGTIDKSNGQMKIALDLGKHEEGHPGGIGEARQLYLKIRYKDEEFISPEILRLYKEPQSSDKSKEGEVYVTVERAFGRERKENCPRCDAELTEAEVKKIFNNITDKDLFKKTRERYTSWSKEKEDFNTTIPEYTVKELTSELNRVMKKYRIDTCRRKSYFLTQIAKETGNLRDIAENKPEALCNSTYGGRYGNENTGDGFKYRGRGLIQLTFQKNYETFGNDIGVSFLDDPDALLQKMEYIVESAGWFWKKGNGSMNPRADLGNFKLVCMRIQGDASTFEERKEILEEQVKPVLYGGSQCKSEEHIQLLPVLDYHIYPGGKIEKHIPNKETFQARYYYHDEEDNWHYLGCYDIIKVQKWVKGSKSNQEGWVKKEKGSDIRYYKKDGDHQAELLRYPSSFEYISGNTKIIYTDKLNRQYINPDAFASFLGALAACGFEDIVCNGFTDVSGCGLPSLTHVNGYNGDFRYLSTNKNKERIHLNHEDKEDGTEGWSSLDEERQNKFIDALHKFGWKNMVSYEYNDKKLNYSVHQTKHYDHLHIQGYDFKFDIINKK